MNLRNLDKNDSSEGGKQEVNNDKSTESEEEYRPKTAAMPDFGSLLLQRHQKMA